MNQLKNLWRRTASCLRSFPMEAASALIFYAVFCASASHGAPRQLSAAAALFPFVATIVYCANRLWGKGMAYYASLPVAAAAVCLFFNLDETVYSLAYRMSLLLALLLLLAVRQPADNRRLARRLARRLMNGVFAVAVGAAATIAALIIIFSFEYVFSISGDAWVYAVGAIFYVIVPLTYCSLEKSAEAGAPDGGNPPRILTALACYVLNPAVLVYAAVLIVYAAATLIAWELPKGGVATMVFGFAVAAFLGLVAQNAVEKPSMGWFYRWLPLIALPTLALFWTGSIHRVADYGLTEERVYLLVGGAVATLSVAALLAKPRMPLRPLLHAAAAAIALFTYIPLVSAADLAFCSQESRLKSRAADLGLLDAATGKLSGTARFSPANAADSLKAAEMAEAYSYLLYCGKMTQGEIEDRFGENHYHADSQYPSVYYIPSSPIDISGYTKFYHHGCSIASDGTVLVGGGNPVARVDLAAHFAAYADSTGTLPLEAFTVKTDGAMVVGSSISRSADGTLSFATYADITVYTK